MARGLYLNNGSVFNVADVYRGGGVYTPILGDGTGYNQ